MKNFEKQLSALPKPDVEVPAFRARLRSSLLNDRPARLFRAPGWALAFTASTAVVFALLLLTCVINPSVPARLHAMLTGGETTDSPDAIPMQELLRRSNAGVERDHAFIEEWSAQQARPVRVRSMEAEKIYAVRQFELTDGKRMLVFTELGNEQADPTVTRADSSVRLY